MIRLFSSYRQARTNSRRPHASRRQPFVELLESRTVPSTFTVTNLADSGLGSLRDAVNQANANPGADTIQFDHGLHGTITLAREIAITDSLTLNGPGSNHLTISGGRTTRVFDISADSVSIADLTIAGGLADSNTVNGSFGGGIYNAAGTLTLTDDVLSSNEADGTAAGDTGWGGGIYNASEAALSVNDSSFVDNVAVGNSRGRGGAVMNDGAATVTHSTFTDNEAIGGNGGSPTASSGSGGAIRNEFGAHLMVSDCTFADNTAIGGTTTTGNGSAGAGGAIWDGFATAVVDNCTFKDNRVSGGNPTTGVGGLGLGGAILVQSDLVAGIATLTLTDSQFIGNESDGGNGGGAGVGGAILTNGDGADTTIANTSFADNQAIGGSGGPSSGLFGAGGLGIGGAILNAFGGSLQVTSALFNGNLAVGGEGSDGWGGAIANVAGGGDGHDTTATITATSFVNNQAIGGAGAGSDNGGNGLGGALFNGGEGVFGSNAPFALQLTVSNCTVANNQAIGSAGANGGNGLGGGLFNDSGNSTATMSNTNLVANSAIGGAASAGGTPGQGIGGSIYNIGTVNVHQVVVKGNHASTSDDDVFGPLIIF
jgi:hypothetical protein